MDDPEQDDEPLEEGMLATIVMANQTDLTRRGIWPEVASDDWCGKWKPEP